MTDFFFLIRVELSLPVPAATIILKDLLDSQVSSNCLDLVAELKVTFLGCFDVYVLLSYSDYDTVGSSEIVAV